jgi:glycerol-3-phosphate dehydrogenase
VLNLDTGRFDAVVVGGGIYGILLALEGASRGQCVLLIERDDFGGGATFNHLRTIHGGLRYLQSLDLRRAVASNQQRLWWLRNFPDLIHPISCLMPLYGRGMRRREVFQLAFLLARALGQHKDGQGKPRRIGVLSKDEVRLLLPYSRERELNGGALWQDAFMPKPHRVVAELLHWAENSGATILNRVEMLSASLSPGRDETEAWRLSVRNRSDDQTAEIATRWVINATGSQTDEVVQRMLGRQRNRILVPTLAWGLLLNRPPVSECSIAVAPPGKNARTYFVHPYNGRVLAGTGHSAMPADAALSCGVTEAQLQATLADLNEAVPGGAFTREQVGHVFQGLLPGVLPGSEQLLKRPRIINHGAVNGAPGAWTVLGVKFTEAPFVAKLLWNKLLGAGAENPAARPPPMTAPAIEEAAAMSDQDLAVLLRRLAEAEWEPSADDLVWRRTDLWMDKTQSRRVRLLEPHWKIRESVSESVPSSAGLD